MDLQKWNFRKITIAAAAALMVGAAHAGGAQIVTLVDAVELSPSNIFLPATVTGFVSYRPCAGHCEEDYRRARLTPDTQFVVGERKVKFGDFQRKFATIRNSKTSYALISVDTKTITVSRIQIEG